MYKEIKGIDVVVYINKNDNKLYTWCAPPINC